LARSSAKIPAEKSCSDCETAGGPCAAEDVRGPGSARSTGPDVRHLLHQDGDYGTFAALFVLVENAQFHAARTLIPRFSHARFIVFRRISF